MRPVSAMPLIVCLPLIATLAIAGCDKAKPPVEQANETAPAVANAATTGIGAEESAVDRTHKGLGLPAMPFDAPGGGPATFGPYRGKPVLVNLWATWCAPCIKELPTIDALAAREQGKLGVVVISEDTGGDKQVAPFWKAKGFKTLTPFTDAKMRLMTGLQVDVLPTTILYDSKGKEVLRVTGGKDWTSADAAKLIAEAR